VIGLDARAGSLEGGGGAARVEPASPENRLKAERTTPIPRGAVILMLLLSPVAASRKAGLDVPNRDFSDGKSDSRFGPSPGQPERSSDQSGPTQSRTSRMAAGGEDWFGKGGSDWPVEASTNSRLAGSVVVWNRSHSNSPRASSRKQG